MLPVALSSSHSPCYPCKESKAKGFTWIRQQGDSSVVPAALPFLKRKYYNRFLPVRQRLSSLAESLKNLCEPLNCMYPTSLQQFSWNSTDCWCFTSINRLGYFGITWWLSVYRCVYSRGSSRLDSKQVEVLPDERVIAHKNPPPIS